MHFVCFEKIFAVLIQEVRVCLTRDMFKMISVIQLVEKINGSRLCFFNQSDYRNHLKNITRKTPSRFPHQNNIYFSKHKKYMQIFQLSGGIENKFFSYMYHIEKLYNFIYLCEVFCFCSKSYVRKLE